MKKEIPSSPLTWRDIVTSHQKFAKWKAKIEGLERLLDEIDLKQEDDIWMANTPYGRRPVVLTTISFVSVIAFQPEDAKPLFYFPCPGIDPKWITRGELTDKYVLFSDGKA